TIKGDNVPDTDPNLVAVRNAATVVTATSTFELDRAAINCPRRNGAGSVQPCASPTPTPVTGTCSGTPATCTFAIPDQTGKLATIQLHLRLGQGPETPLDWPVNQVTRPVG